MKKKKKFIQPEILQEARLIPETPILTGSVVDNVTIVSTGQDVKEHDFSDSTLNHEWE
ncbi:MAG: hypothetical protein K5910_09175 [Bacteroidales bacterium]|nr:hypothetical protein [Bacteroidales bacterium]